jgi:hypothetical protein
MCNKWASREQAAAVEVAAARQPLDIDWLDRYADNPYNEMLAVHDSACGSPCLVRALLHDLRYDSILASVVGVLLHHFRYDSLQLNNYFQKEVLSIVSVCL